MVYLASNVVMAALVALAMGAVTCHPVVALVAAFGAGMLAVSAAMTRMGRPETRRGDTKTVRSSIPPMAETAEPL